MYEQRRFGWWDDGLLVQWLWSVNFHGCHFLCKRFFVHMGKLLVIIEHDVYYIEWCRKKFILGGHVNLKRNQKFWCCVLLWNGFMILVKKEKIDKTVHSSKKIQVVHYNDKGLQKFWPHGCFYSTGAWIIEIMGIFMAILMHLCLQMW